jgi:hypothetical protein
MFIKQQYPVKEGKAPMAESVQDIYIAGLRNAHALEVQAMQLLERQVERIDSYPEMLGSISRSPARSRSGWSRSWTASARATRR